MVINNMAVVLLGFAIGGVVAFTVQKLLNNHERFINKRNCTENCTFAHEENGGNYEWLTPLGYGTVKKIEYKEPPDTGKWLKYTDEIWQAHCSVVSHDPKYLIDEHMTAFVYKNSRFAILRFTFSSGKVITSDDDNAVIIFKRFYELERDYFQENGCVPDN